MHQSTGSPDLCRRLRNAGKIQETARGMLLAAVADGDELKLVTVDDDSKSGSAVQ